mmetsp:Transcript_57950/g.136570  ORF Transcript_57950/g.136570 Transcript_57950/m.136570 type:complete len:426 (-) Transcript_57950:27-1304(-)
MEAVCRKADGHLSIVSFDCTTSIQTEIVQLSSIESPTHVWCLVQTSAVVESVVHFVVFSESSPPQHASVSMPLGNRVFPILFVQRTSDETSCAVLRLLRQAVEPRDDRDHDTSQDMPATVDITRNSDVSFHVNPANPGIVCGVTNELSPVHPLSYVLDAVLGKTMLLASNDEPCDDRRPSPLFFRRPRAPQQMPQTAPEERAAREEDTPEKHLKISRLVFFQDLSKVLGALGYSPAQHFVRCSIAPVILALLIQPLHGVASNFNIQGTALSNLLLPAIASIVGALFLRARHNRQVVRANLVWEELRGQNSAMGGASKSTDELLSLPGLVGSTIRRRHRSLIQPCSSCASGNGTRQRHIRFDNDKGRAQSSVFNFLRRFFQALVLRSSKDDSKATEASSLHRTASGLTRNASSTMFRSRAAVAPSD